MQDSPAKAPEQPDAILAAMPPLKRRRTSAPRPQRQDKQPADSPADAAGGLLLPWRCAVQSDAWQHLRIHIHPGSTPLPACLKGLLQDQAAVGHSAGTEEACWALLSLHWLLAGDLSKLLEAYLKHGKAADAEDADVEEADRHMSASSDDVEDEDVPGRGWAAGRGRRSDLARLKQLSEQLLRARTCRAIHLVPLEQLQRLLKALDAQLMRGRDQVLHRGEQVCNRILRQRQTLCTGRRGACCLTYHADAI